MQKLSTGPFSGSKKSGTKREGSPCTPYKRKARGKENNPDALSTGLFACAGAGAREVERIRRREVLLKRHVEAAVEDALVAFCGKRRNLHFDAEAEEAREREHSTSWLSDRGKGAATIRRCGPSRTDVWRKREAAAIKKVRRKAPHLLPVLRLILKNGNNREKSICELRTKIGTRKK